MNLITRRIPRTVIALGVVSLLADPSSEMIWLRGDRLLPGVQRGEVQRGA